MADEYEVPAQIGRYLVEDEIGRGAMGVVYRVHDPKFACTRALKILRKELIEEEETTARFREEGRSAVRAAGELAHPNIVTVYDVGEFEERPYIVMEMFRGMPLDKLMADNAPLSLTETVRIAGQLAQALDSAHSHGVVHRDVKPANILVSEDLRTAKLTDFSVARVKSNEDHSLTKTGVVIGAPRYMSPEQALGRKVDGRADLYALGIVLFELLTGRKAFQSDTITALLIEITQTPPPPIRTLRPDIPPALDHIVSKLLKKEPDARFQTGKELAGALTREGERLAEAKAKQKGGRPELVAAVGFAALIFVILSILSFGVHGKLRNDFEVQSAAIAVLNAKAFVRQDSWTRKAYPKYLDQKDYKYLLEELVEAVPDLAYAHIVTSDDDIYVSTQSVEGGAPYIPFTSLRKLNIGISQTEANIAVGPNSNLYVQVSTQFEGGEGNGNRRLILGLKTDRMRAMLRSTDQLLILLVLLATTAVLLLTYMFARRYLKPLAELSGGLRIIADGNYDVRMPDTGLKAAADAYTSFNNAVSVIEQRLTNGPLDDELSEADTVVEESSMRKDTKPLSPEVSDVISNKPIGDAATSNKKTDEDAANNSSSNKTVIISRVE